MHHATKHARPCSHAASTRDIYAAYVFRSSSRGDSSAAHLLGDSDALAVLMAPSRASTPSWKRLGSSCSACSATGGGSHVVYMLVVGITLACGPVVLCAVLVL